MAVIRQGQLMGRVLSLGTQDDREVVESLSPETIAVPCQGQGAPCRSPFKSIGLP